MNDYLRDLELAFKGVEIDNYNWDALRPNKDIYIQEPENNFTSEIISNLRNLMKKNENRERYLNLRCHFDVLKYRISIKPDIVLHESPDNQNRQIFLCEVKIDSGANLKDDLIKLKRAISDELNFENAVMIVANKTLTSTEKKIKEQFQNSSHEDLEKLYLFHSIPINNELKFTIKKFSEIIE